MTQTFTEFARFLAKRQHGGRVLLVAIDGYGGSGKSTFANILHGALRRAGVTPVTTVEADGFVMNLREEDWRPLPSMPGMRAPYRIDVERQCREVLEPLRRGLPAQFVHRDWWYAEQAKVRIVHSHGSQAGSAVLTRTFRNRLSRRGCTPAGPESSRTRVTFRSLSPFLIHDERLSAHEAGRWLRLASTDPAAVCQAMRERRPEISEA